MDPMQTIISISAVQYAEKEAIQSYGPSLRDPSYRRKMTDEQKRVLLLHLKLKWKEGIELYSKHFGVGCKFV